MKGFALIKRLLLTRPSGSVFFRANEDNITLAGLTRFDAVLSPSQITGNQNNYSPTGLEDANVLRLSTDASRNITGLVPGSQSGRLLLLFNVGSNDLVLKNESASSTAANRFAIGGDFTVTGGGGVVLWYDSTSSRWRVAGGI